jgi:hypothetical protein
MELPTTLATGVIWRTYSAEHFEHAILDVFKAMRDYGVL